EQDVTIQRVVTALSAPVKKAFADFSSAPFVARVLFAEVASERAQDQYAVLDYDGDFATSRGFAFVAGSDEASEAIRSRLEDLGAGVTAKKAEKILKDAWGAGREEGATTADELT